MNSSVIISLCLFLFAPAALLALTEHYRWAKRAGAIVLCYACGLLWGNVGFQQSDLESHTLAAFQSQFADIAIAMALPMLLMTLNVRSWWQHASSAILSMLFAITAVVTMSSTLFFMMPSGSDTIDASHLAGMAVGVYTGGTPNLAAIKAGLDIPNAHYLIFHSLDTLVGAFYLVFMLSFAIPLIRRWLPDSSSDVVCKNSKSSNQETSDQIVDASAQALDAYGEDYKPLMQTKHWPQLVRVTLQSLLCVGIAAGITEWAVTQFAWQNPTALTIVLLTLFGIALSFIPSVQQQRLAYRYGMYWIYMFCFAVASMANFETLTQVNPITIVFIVGAVVGSLLLHGILCRLFRVDADTFMVTSVAAICSPPFVPLMARALNNSSLILSGMTTGIIGYALGNVLGISLALALSSIT